jgi:hypothetical protein
LEYRFPEQRNRIMASIENARAKTGLSALVLAIIQLGFLLQLALRGCWKPPRLKPTRYPWRVPGFLFHHYYCSRPPRFSVCRA